MKLKYCFVGLGLTCLSFGMMPGRARSQEVPETKIVKEANSTTDVSRNAANPNQIDIRGGKTANIGNLFHSFQEFGLDQNQIANFEVNRDVSNVMARVVGGNPSKIYGQIKVSANGGNPTLYLMNPAGILFGPNSSLNVPGSFVATTANGIGIRGFSPFSAVGSNSTPPEVLSGAPDALIFTMKNPGAIVQAGNLAVNPGRSIVLAGGSVINIGTLKAPGGDITIAAVPGEKLVLINQQGSLLRLGLPTALDADLTRSLPNLLPPNFNPVSIPQLLTGGNVSDATGITITNGQIFLTASGQGLPSSSQSEITSNQIAATEGVTISGNLQSNSDIVISNTILSDSNNLTINAKNVTLLGDATVSDSFNIKSTGAVVTSDITINQSGDSPTGVVIESEGSIQTGNINSRNSAQLTSRSGNIVVNSIAVNSSDPNKIATIRITTPGIFQARGSFPISTESQAALPIDVINIDDPRYADIKQFLITRGALSPDGNTIQQDFNQIPDGQGGTLPIISRSRTVRLQPLKGDAPVSLAVSESASDRPQIVIKHGGSSRYNVSNSFLTIEGSNRTQPPFVIPIFKKTDPSSFSIERVLEGQNDANNSTQPVAVITNTLTVRPLEFGSSDFPQDSSGVAGIFATTVGQNVKASRYYASQPLIPTTPEPPNAKETQQTESSKCTQDDNPCKKKRPVAQARNILQVDPRLLQPQGTPTPRTK
jgi:filamentous hemagglutinin family protein